MHIDSRDEGSVRIDVRAGYRVAAAGWGFATFFLWVVTALPLLVGELVSRAVGAPGASPGLFSGMIVAFLPFAVFGIFLVVWAIAGREEITVEGATFAVARRLWGVPVGGRRYDARAVERVRVAPHPYMKSWNPWAPLLGGVIAFDYGAMTYRFGTGLDADEASRAVEALGAAVGLAREVGEPPDRSTVRLPAYRCRVVERSDGITVTMPYDFRLLPRPLWYILGWVPLSAVVVGLGVASATGSLVPVASGGLISVLVVGVLVLTQGSFLRLHEVIDVVPDAELFERRIEYWGFRSSGTRLNLGYVREMRVELPPGGDVGRAYADMARKRSGVIAVDFGKETYRFGLWTSEAEALRVVSEVVSRFPEVGA